MEHRIEIIAEKKLIGKRVKMTLSDNRTFELWKSFMPERKKIINNLTSELFSLQVYGKNFNFKEFSFCEEFEKWAAVEVCDLDSIPENMEPIILTGGLYAVFIHKGPASTGQKTFQYIYTTWLPGSGYDVDNRPHFEILGNKYKHEDPDSEEEVWIPIKPKK
jgi:AraC family transcriptional regulator